VAISSVYPSGGCFATNSAPTSVPRPGFVLDHDRLIQPSRESLGDGAGEKIGERARRIRHDELDRSRGIRLL
jgi:hypothetical protein